MMFVLVEAVKSIKNVVENRIYKNTQTMGVFFILKDLLGPYYLCDFISFSVKKSTYEFKILSSAEQFCT